mgnify:CR=1 FL=1
MGGRKSTGIDAIWWVKRAEQLGAGEILLNSMDADGTKEGFDLEMIRAVRKEVKIPIIASGGAGKVEDFPPAIEAGADAVLAASVFHYGILTIADVKGGTQEARLHRSLNEYTCSRWRTSSELFVAMRYAHVAHNPGAVSEAD